MELRAVSADPSTDPDNYDRLLGQLALLGATTPTFGCHRLDHAVSTLHGALMSGQFRVYVTPAGRPAAALIWAMLNDKTAEAYLATGRLPDVAAWTSGDDLWLLSVIADPPSLKHVLRDAFGTLFKNHARAFVLRPGRHGTRRVVEFTRKGARVVRRLPGVDDQQT